MGEVRPSAGEAAALIGSRCPAPAKDPEPVRRELLAKLTDPARLALGLLGLVLRRRLDHSGQASEQRNLGCLPGPLSLSVAFGQRLSSVFATQAPWAQDEWLD